jgi:acyl dehydratase
MLKDAPVSTKYLSLVNLSVKKIKPVFAGKCIAMAVACVGKAAEPKEVLRRISFPTKNRANAPVIPIGVVIVKFTHAIARVLK